MLIYSPDFPLLLQAHFISHLLIIYKKSAKSTYKYCDELRTISETESGIWMEEDINIISGHWSWDLLPISHSDLTHYDKLWASPNSEYWQNRP